MANSPKICLNKDCGKELQPEDQYCANCGIKVPEGHVFDKRYFIAIGLGFLIIGIVAGSYASITWYDTYNQILYKNGSQILYKNESKILDSAGFLKLRGDQALGLNNSKALYYYKKATEKDFSAREAWVNMGNLYLSERNYSNALECYKNASEFPIRDPSETMGDLCFEIAFKNKSLSDLDNASKYYDITAEVPTSPLNKKSNILFNWTEKVEKNDIRKLELLRFALKSNNLSIEIDQDDPESWKIRWHIYTMLHEITENELYDDVADKCHENMTRLLDARK